MTNTKRPFTVKEMQDKKKKRSEEDSKKITITNVSKQLVTIHLKAPKGIDFYFGNQDIHLRPNQTHQFPQNRLISGQVDRLQKTRFIKVM